MKGGTATTTTGLASFGHETAFKSEGLTFFQNISLLHSAFRDTLNKSAPLMEVFID
jgi:hypothetical protein